MFATYVYFESNFCFFLRYGLDSDPRLPRTTSSHRNNTSGGFVDLSNEYASGHQPSNADEVFASEQGDKPW